MSIYILSVQDQNGGVVLLEQYRGKALLIVNTATECGFTPHYEELQAIYDKFDDKGLRILDYPCNPSGNQAPGSDAEIYTFCTCRCGITFPQMTKGELNDKNAIPLFKWLTVLSRPIYEKGRKEDRRTDLKLHISFPCITPFRISFLLPERGFFVNKLII